MTGAKLGSYILNRFGNFSTVTKDMWYARTMARLSGEKLVGIDKETGKESAIKTPWAESTKEGKRKRELADKAFKIVADNLGTSPAMVQERIWDFEKRLYEMLGANEDAAYVSDGLNKGIEIANEEAKDTSTDNVKGRKQIEFKSKNNYEYTVSDDGEIIGRLRLVNNRDLGKGYLEVDTSVILDDYIGRGIGSNLYRVAAKNLKDENIVITSSKFRTDKSQTMWERLEKAGEAIKMYSDSKLKKTVYALINPKEVEFETKRYQKDGVEEISNLDEPLLKKTIKDISDVDKKDMLDYIKENEYKPKKTVKAYKLFRVNEKNNGQLFPLFVNADKAVPFGTWIKAAIGEEVDKTKTGNRQVKSKLGPLAFRPGWHSGDFPVASHIGDKANKEDTAPSVRPTNQVWAEIEVANDFDWQTEATNRAEKTKAGGVNLRTAHITDRLPDNGYYKYKTNSNMTGSWLISGEMKVNRILSDEEVKSINKENNASDLIRLTPFEYEKYGFNKEGLPVNKETKKIIL
jgi:predicted GNAT family acetyltransferase